MLLLLLLLRTLHPHSFMYTGDGSSWTEARVRVLDITSLPHGGCNITMQQPGKFSLFHLFPFVFS
jgi:hypothetical protein